MLTILQIIRMCDCDFSPLVRFTVIAEHFPHLFCLLFLSIRIPYRFFTDFPYRKGYFSSLREKRHEMHTFEDLKASDIGLHVIDLLKKPKDKEQVRVGFKAKAIGFLLDHTYRAKPGFRYSARFLSTILVALILLYVVAFEAFVFIYVIRSHLRRVFIGDLQTALLGEEHIEDVKELIKYCIRTFVCAVAISSALGLYGIVRMFTQYRTMMFSLYKGQMKQLWADRSSADLLLSAMKYSGYQVVSVVWGFIIHTLIFLVFCTIMAVLIYLLRHGVSDWFTHGLLQLWPIPFWAVIINVVQMVMTRKAFLANDGRHLVLNNRRVLFVMSYFLFFYNIFLGIFSSLLRMIKSVVIGSIILPRLDYSVLPERFVSMDPGYLTHVGFMKLESDHSHPVMLVFIRLLYIGAKMSRRGRKSGGGKTAGPRDDEDQTDWWGTKAAMKRNEGIRRNQDQIKRRSKLQDAAFKWQVLYTLINNPDLRVERKGYIQRSRRARELGITLPKSDVYVVIDEDLLREAEEDHERKNANFVGKITSAAGQNFNVIKNKIHHLHTYLKERGSSETLDQSGDEEKDGRGHKNRGFKTRSEENIVCFDSVDSTRRDGDSQKISRSSKGLEASRESGDGDMKLAFVSNKRRRRQERERRSEGDHVEVVQIQPVSHNRKGNSRGVDECESSVDPVRPPRGHGRESREIDRDIHNESVHTNKFRGHQSRNPTMNVEDRDDTDRTPRKDRTGQYKDTETNDGDDFVRPTGAGYNGQKADWFPTKDRGDRQNRRPRSAENGKSVPKSSLAAGGHDDARRSDRSRTGGRVSIQGDGYAQDRAGRNGHGRRRAGSYDDDHDVVDNMVYRDKDDYDDGVVDTHIDGVRKVWMGDSRDAMV